MVDGERPREMEHAFSAGNLGKPFSIIRLTGLKSEQIRENIESSHTVALYSKEQTL